VARGQSYLPEIQDLLQQPPSSEGWRDLADLFSMVSGSSARRRIDWQSLLQHLLQQAPDPALWKAILNLFVAWPKNDTRNEAIYVAARQLDQWDDVLRHISAGWGPLYEQGNRISALGVLARSLQIYQMSEVSTQILKSIAHSPYLCNLTHLSIYRCEEIDPEAFAHLARSPFLHKLQHLEIHRSDLGMNDSYYDFSPSSMVDQMRSLQIVPRRVYFFDLMRSPVTARLRWLKLTSLYLKDWYVDVLTQTTFAPQLEHLDLGDNGITAKGVQLIANTPNFQTLTHLDLSQNYIGDAGAQHLAQSPHLNQLQELHLVNTGVKQTGRQALLNAPHLRNTKIVFERSQL
jgi:hypothetical protein